MIILNGRREETGRSMGICIHASILLQSQPPNTHPMQNTYIYYAVTATIPFFVWLELVRLPPSIAYETQQKEGRTDDGHPSYLVSVPAAEAEAETAAAAASQSAVPLPSFPLPLSSFLPLRYPTYLFLATRSRHIAIAVCSTAPHPYLASLPPSSHPFLSPTSSTPMPSHGGIAQQDTDCKRGRTKSNSISFSAVSRNRATKCPVRRKAS